MYYINEQSTENGNHGSPQSNQTLFTVQLPDELLSVYLDTMGFANIIVEDGKVTQVSVNQAALDAYNAANHNAQEPDLEFTTDNLFEAQLYYTAIMTNTLLEV